MSIKTEFDLLARQVSRLKNDPTAKFVKGFDFRNAPGIVKKLNQIIGSKFISNTGTLQRYMKGINPKEFSDAVWNLSRQTQWELQTHLAIGIMNGDSPAVIARRIQKYLNTPITPFRRVRDANGRLVPSKNMLDYHPGRGVYRSAYKNALRLVKEEKKKFRFLALQTKWIDDDNIVGIRISLSPAHPDYGYIEICEVLEGDYPKDIVFTGWHAQCLCIMTPIRDKKVVSLPANYKKYFKNR
jgi:hypothetical protein